MSDAIRVPVFKDDNIPNWYGDPFRYSCNYADLSPPGKIIDLQTIINPQGEPLSLNITTAYIKVINIYNLDCLTCYNRSGKTHAWQELSFANIVRIVDRLIYDFGCTRILLSGGEPTLHTEFDQILNYLLSLDIEVDIVTNGTTDNQSLIAAYDAHAKLTIQVSLDGSFEENNTQTRGHGNFDKAVDFFSHLNCLDKHPVLKMIISQNNIHDVEAYYCFAFSIKCDPDFAFINDMGTASDAWYSLELTAQQKLSVLRNLERLNQKYQLIVDFRKRQLLGYDIK